MSEPDRNEQRKLRKRKRQRDRWRRKYERLQSAVVALYAAAFWTPDVPVENEGQLWRDLRDAAGIDEGTKTNIVFRNLEERREER